MNDTELYFKYRCEKGLKERGLSGKKEYEERIAYEIRIITQMEFCGYFLVVSDILTWALDRKIPVGPGRGSVAGSLVAYALKITHLDPIKYGLIFERFLNPDRVSMPDCDMDFCKLRRGEVIARIEEKYGKDKVAHIGTFGSMKAKASIRDVARARGFDYSMGDTLAKLTLEPIEGKPQPLKTCYDKVPALNNMRYGPVSDEQEVLIWAERMENRIRSFGTHASGVVISRDKLARTIPLYPGKDGCATTQFEMNTVEEVGLIKFDFLGLRALTTIQHCVDLVKDRHGIEIDPLLIPVDDDEVYKQLQEGDVSGVFQLEGSSGMRDLLIQIKPSRLEDLSLLVAIYRPGPLESEMLQHYLKVRAGEATARYAIPELKPILGETDGMLIYQEQILTICRELAGYTMGEADLMRRAVGKKKEKEMAAQEEKFKAGMVENGIDLQDAVKIWNDIKAFASYGFNKAHSACYGFISYQMAYLKTHFPVEFMAACLTTNTDDPDEVIKYISYCKSVGIKILGPSVNESEYDFSIAKDNKNIRFGLSAVKNLGKPIQEIIDERTENGPFKNPLDFVQRVNLSKINRKKLESLVLAGAFDDFGFSRNSLMAFIDQVLEHKALVSAYEKKKETYDKKIVEYLERQVEIEEWNKKTKEEQKAARADGEKKPGKKKEPVCPEAPIDPEVPLLKELPTDVVLRSEKELLGYFVSGHPLDSVTEVRRWTLAAIKEVVQERKVPEKTKIEIIAVPSVIKEIVTKKKKQKMAYMQLEDRTGTIDAVMYPATYELQKDLLDTSTPIRIQGQLEIKESDTGIVCSIAIHKIQGLQSVLLSQNEVLTIKISTAQDLIDLSKKLKSMEGDTRIQIILTSKGKEVRFPVIQSGVSKIELLRVYGN